MTSKGDTNEEDSFIVLGTSPGASIEVNGYYGEGSLDHVQLDDALKDLSVEAGMAFKAHFKIGDAPSPASLMVASNIITDDKTTEDLQKRFGEILDENKILKETLQQNNESMKEQFLLIASCQEDMLKTHMVHKEKFDETRELVEKLRQENKKLKSDIARVSEEALSHSSNVADSETGEPSKSGPSSALEFVTSPDDDTINKLTAQLELVEKQRRQVIVENDKLTWQKESLERIIDATSKERDDLKEKIQKLELQSSTTEYENLMTISNLHVTIQQLQDKLNTTIPAGNILTEDLAKRDARVQQLESKVSSLQADLKTTQLKVLELESVKLEYSKYKSGTHEATRMYKEQIAELNNRLKEVQTTVFQPVRFSVGDGEPASGEFGSFRANVSLYDKTLKHLSQLLNMLVRGTSDSIVQTLGVVASLHDYKLDRSSAEQFKTGLAEVKQLLEKQHTSALGNIGQVKSTLTIFEGIFKDYNELLKKSLSKPEPKAMTPNVEALSAALVARGQEMQALEAEIRRLKIQHEDTEHLKAQMEIYKSDFEAEREAREKMASEKETLLTDIRMLKRRHQEFIRQADEACNGGVQPTPVRSPFTKRPVARTSPASPTSPSSAAATGNKVYTCPKCMRFSSDQYKVMDDHFDFCLEDF